ncbi:MAG: spermidine/putrescine ABC transporter substrate-binding protein [Deltaproteobacteria bacterium]|nr:spermidine/putrescine ABC transporter substrate-binding protein [Deltaproteobacteria bacterium]
MKKLTILLLTAMLLLLSVSVWAEQKELRVFIWSEYLDPAIPAAFEKETGIKVRIDLYESNEDMLAKLQAGGVSQYDIIVPSDYIMPALIQLGMLQKLDHAKIPNLKNLKPLFKETSYDPGNKYSVAYQWGTIGLLYRTDLLKHYNGSWSTLFDPTKNPGNFLLLDSSREMLGITLLYLGYDFNSTDPKELLAAADLLATTKKRDDCLGFKGGVGGKNDVVAGSAAVAIVYNGDGIQAMSNNPDIPLAFAIPKEGSELWYDSMAIPAKAPNPDAAHKWINYILDAKVGAKLSNYNRFATPNAASMPFITPEDLKNPGIYPDEATMKTLFFSKDLGNKMKLVDEAWTRAKSH